MTKFIIVRHGESKSNEGGRLVGITDVPLSELGKKQAKAVCRYLLKTYQIDAIYSSPLSRAYNTIKGAAKGLRLPINVEKELIEISVGEWEGLSYEELKRDHAEAYAVWRTDIGVAAPVGGETMAQVQERALKKLKEIAKKEDGKTVLIGTHAGVIRSLQCYMQGLPIVMIKNIPWVVNTSIAEVDFDGENFYIHKFGFDGHLARLKEQSARIKV